MPAAVHKEWSCRGSDRLTVALCCSVGTEHFGECAGKDVDVMIKEDIYGCVFVNLSTDGLSELGLSMDHRKLLISRLQTIQARRRWRGGSMEDPG